MVRYQKSELPKAVGEEYRVLSSKKMIHSERNRHRVLGKYVESITHSIAGPNKKMMSFNAQIWGCKESPENIKEISCS